MQRVSRKVDSGLHNLCLVLELQYRMHTIVEGYEHFSCYILRHPENEKRKTLRHQFLFIKSIKILTKVKNISIVSSSWFILLQLREFIVNFKTILNEKLDVRVVKQL